MCKTCQGEEDKTAKGSGEEEKLMDKHLHTSTKIIAHEEKKKGENKGLSWKEAIRQTAILEDQERDMILNGWSLSVAIRLDKIQQRPNKKYFPEFNNHEIKLENK